ncbi:MAG: hypothetical protein M3140_07660 [Actinomycetota bacterium]|nr:hypothetical protein [Actinomycetota bacterium]
MTVTFAGAAARRWPLPELADFAAVDFAAVDFAAIGLVAADFLAADLVAADLVAADLVAADLVAADLVAADSVAARGRAGPAVEEAADDFMENAAPRAWRRPSGGHTGPIGPAQDVQR